MTGSADSVNFATDQYLRRWSLILTSSKTGDGQVLSQSAEGFDLRMTFQTQAADGPTPGIAIITIYNLSTQTAANAVNEFDKIILQAGYKTGKFGVIFSGTIKQFERAHESPTDSYLRVFAADWDLGYTTAVVNTTLKANWTDKQRQAELDRRWADKGITQGYRDPLVGGINPHPRSRVMFGMSVDEQHDAAASTNQAWSVEDGKLKLMKADRSTNLPAPPLEMNAKTGMVGWPKSTNQGIQVTCLINPSIKVGGLIRINNKDINQTNAPEGGTAVFGFPGFRDFNYFATVTDDGIYRVLVREHEGDSRGEPWYTNLTCLAVDATTAENVTGVKRFPRAVDAASFAAGRS